MKVTKLLFKLETSICRRRRRNNTITRELDCSSYVSLPIVCYILYKFCIFQYPVNQGKRNIAKYERRENISSTFATSINVLGTGVESVSVNVFRITLRVTERKAVAIKTTYI